MTTKTPIKLRADLVAVNILAKLWFDRKNGNTYHTVTLTEVYADKVTHSYESTMTYGYGQQWDQTALDIFAQRNSIEIPRYANGNKEYSYLTSLLRESSIAHPTHIIEVSRKRDL